MTAGCGTAGDALGVGIAAAGSAWFSLTLLSGIVGSLARNYIPMNDLQGSIQIKITFSVYTQVGKWTTDLHTASNTTIYFSKIEIRANMIKLGSEVLSMIRTP